MGGGNTPSGDIGYEEIYQFYKKLITTMLPQELLNNHVIPETFNDIQGYYGHSYENGKKGIWFCYYDSIQDLSYPMLLFTTFDNNNMIEKCIFLGEYVESDK